MNNARHRSKRYIIFTFAIILCSSLYAMRCPQIASGQTVIQQKTDCPEGAAECNNFAAGGNVIIEQHDLSQAKKELLQRLESIQSTDPHVMELKTQARRAIEADQFAEAEKLLNQTEQYKMESPPSPSTGQVNITQELNCPKDSQECKNYAAGRDLIIKKYGISQALYNQLRTELDVNDQALTNFFFILDKEGVPRDKLRETLQEIAEQYKELLQRWAIIQSDDPQVIELRTQAKQAIENGEFNKAETLLNQAKARKMQTIEQLAKQSKEIQVAIEKEQLSVAEMDADNARLQEIQLRYSKAADYWRQAATLLPEDEQQTRAWYLNSAGYDFRRVARYADALPLYEQSLAIFREIGDTAGEGVMLNNISQIYGVLGDYATALTYLEQSLAIRRKIGDKAGEGITCGNIGGIHYAQGDLAKALTFFEQSLTMFRETGNKAEEGTTMVNIGAIHYAQGNLAKALTFFGQSLTMFRETGNKAEEGTTLNNISQIYDARGDHATALTYLDQSLAIFREIGDKAGEGTTLNNISQIYHDRGDLTTALTYLEQSLAIFREIGDKAGEGGTLNNISTIYDAKGDYATALTYLEQSLAISREIGDKAGEGITCGNIGWIHYAQGDLAKAEQYIRQSVEIAEATGHPDLEMRRAALEKIRAQRRAAGGE